GCYGRRGCDVHVAEGAADREAGPCELCGALLADEKNDVAAGSQQPSAEISADGPAADHQYAHDISPLLLLLARRSAGHHRVVDDCLHHLAPLIERPGPHLHQPAIRPRPSRPYFEPSGFDMQFIARAHRDRPAHLTAAEADAAAGRDGIAF